MSDTALRRGTRGGRFVVIAGPDGIGKSSLSTALIERLTAAGHPVWHFHHRLRALPASAASLRPTTNPHALSPYPLWLSTAKVLYLFADELLGWLVKVRTFRLRGGWVVVERGWWDLAVDPFRYRISPRRRLVVSLGRLLPAPDLTIILSAPEEVIQSRKTELGPEELARQLRLWKSVAEDIPRAALVDASQPIETIVDSISDMLNLGARKP